MAAELFVDLLQGIFSFQARGKSGLSVVTQVRKDSRTIHRLPCFLLLGNKKCLACIA